MIRNKFGTAHMLSSLSSALLVPLCPSGGRYLPYLILTPPAGGYM